jgi:hypothetical protein
MVEPNTARVQRASTEAGRLHGPGRKAKTETGKEDKVRPQQKVLQNLALCLTAT